MHNYPLACPAGIKYVVISVLFINCNDHELLLLQSKSVLTKKLYHPRSSFDERSKIQSLVCQRERMKWHHYSISWQWKAIGPDTFSMTCRKSVFSVQKCSSLLALSSNDRIFPSISLRRRKKCLARELSTFSCPFELSLLRLLPDLLLSSAWTRDKVSFSASNFTWPSHMHTTVERCALSIWSILYMFARLSEDAFHFVQKRCEFLLFISKILVAADTCWRTYKSNEHQQQLLVKCSHQCSFQAMEFVGGKDATGWEYQRWAWYRTRYTTLAPSYCCLQCLATPRLTTSWSTQLRRVLTFYGMRLMPPLQLKTICRHTCVPCWVLVDCRRREEFWKYLRGDWLVNFGEVNRKVKALIAFIRVITLHNRNQRDLN